MIYLRPLPPASYLASCLRYVDETGCLFWLRRPPTHFSGKRKGERERWSTRYVGRPALNFIGEGGYRIGFLDSTMYLTHRIVWRLCYGTEPLLIDHIDGNRTNNRLGNLRSVDHLTNGRNRAQRHGTLTEFAGVTVCNRTGRFRARIGVAGMHSLGSFDHFEDAAAARLEAEKQHDFTVRNRKGLNP